MSQLAFACAIRKYGINVWTHEILQKITTKEDANANEIKWISYFDSTNPLKGYNKHAGGTGGCMSDESLKKWVVNLKENPNHQSIE